MYSEKYRNIRKNEKEPKLFTRRGNDILIEYEVVQFCSITHEIKNNMVVMRKGVPRHKLMETKRFVVPMIKKTWQNYEAWKGKNKINS